MMMFWIIASLMVLLALLIVLIPLVRPAKPRGPDRSELNARIYRQRLQELNVERERGGLGAEQYEQARTELGHTLLEDTSGEPEAQMQKRGGRWAIVLLIVAVPALAIALYQHYGRADLLSDTQVVDESALTGDHESLARVVNRLVERQRQQPGDVRGWALLGRSYLVLGRYEDAVRAYGRAVQLAPDNPDLLTDYAEAVAMGNGERLQGRPRMLIDQALALNPKHEKALWLAGIADFEAGDYAAAADLWRRLKSSLPVDSEGARFVQGNIAKAESMMAESQSPETAAGNATVTAAVDILPELRGQMSSESRVFIFARAVNGPAMPLALAQAQLGELPVTVTLNDSMAMSPAAKLSRFPEVMIVARVSQSGRAGAQSGDLEGSIGPVKIGEQKSVKVTIDRKIP